MVAVHGINNTYAAPTVMAAEWIPALLGGVTLAGGDGLLTPDDVGCVFYGDVFRRPGRYLGGDGLEWLTPEDIEDEQDAALLGAWWCEAARVDPGVIPPDARTLGTASGVQAALAALADRGFSPGPPSGC